MATKPKIPDLPDIPQGADDLRSFLLAVKEILQTREGWRGARLDKGVTFRDLLDLGLAAQTASGNFDGTAGAGPKGDRGPPGQDGPPGTPYVPDYTAPPTPSGLESTSLFRGIFVEWDPPTYTVGHGNAYTEVFIAQYGGTGPLPTFSNAVSVGKAAGATSIFTYPAPIGTQLHIWIAFVTEDGVASATPAGGLNGSQVTVGTIGTTDLGPLIVQAGNLASGAVTPIKLAVQIGGGNLAANSSFEADSNADGMADGWGAFVGGGGDGGRAHAFSRPTKAPGVIGAVCQELKIISATNSADSILTQITPEPVAALSPYVVSAHLSSNSAGAYMLVREFDSGGGELISHSAAPVGVGGWVRTSIQFTTQATCASVRTMFRGIVNANEYVRVDGVQIEPGDVMTAYAPRPDEILPGTITETEIGPEAVTTPKLAAYSVVASKVAAQAIQTQHLLVTGRGALNADPEFKDPSAWVAFAEAFPEFVTIGYGPSGTTAIRSPAAGMTSWINAADRIPIDSTKTYRVSCKAGLVHPPGSSPGTFYMGVALFNGSGANIAGDGSQWFYAASAQTLSTTWAEFEGEFGAGTARTFPSNARYMAPLVILSYAASDSRMECQDLRINEKVGFSLIVKGGILAEHLAANTLAVGMAAIDYAIIRRALIEDAAVDNAKIANMSAAKLTAGSISVGEYLQSTGYVSGSAGWKINGNGTAEFSGVVVRGTIYAAAGQIGGSTISSTAVYSSNYAPGLSGWILRDDGTVEFGAANIRGQLTTSQIQVGAATGRGVTIDETGWVENWTTSAQTLTAQSSLLTRDYVSAGRAMTAFADIRLDLRHRGVNIAGVRADCLLEVVRTDTMAVVCSTTVTRLFPLAFNGWGSNGMGSSVQFNWHRPFDGISGVTYRIRAATVTVSSFDSSGAAATPGGSVLSPSQKTAAVYGTVILREDKV